VVTAAILARVTGMDPLEQLRSRFTGLRLQEETTAGKVYAGQDPDGTEVTIAVLTGQAASDPGARGAFADVVWQHSVGAVPGQATVTSADLHAVFPWAAARTPPGGAGAEQLLARVVDLPDAAAPVPADQPPAPVSPLAPVSPPVTDTPPEPVSPLPILPGRVRLPVRSRLAPLTRSGSPWPWLLGAAGGVLLVLVAATAIGAVQTWLDTEPGARTTGPQSTGPQSTGAPGATAPAGPDESAGGGPDPVDPDLPVLREVAPVSVVGATFAPDEPAESMAPLGWPIAFRLPPGWDCFEGRLDEMPAAEYYDCRDQPEGGDQRVGVILQECPTSCTEGEQEQMLEEWLDVPQAAVRVDGAPTAYVETGRNEDGNYSVDLGHFFGPEPGGPLRWLVGVYAESPLETRADVQKILNDIVSQATV
jgi:hypothetical protein